MDTYKINTLIEVRFLSKSQISGITDLKMIVSDPNGVYLSPVTMTELVPGIYHSTFTPNLIGIWNVEISSVSHPEDVFAKAYLVLNDYNYTLLDTDGTLSANSDSRVSTQKAIKTYVDSKQAFPIDYHEIESNGLSSTSLNTFVNKLTLTWTPPVIGTYLLNWYAEVSNSNSNQNTNVRFQYGGVDISNLSIRNSLTEVQNGFTSFQGFILKPLTAISTTLTIDYTAGANTAFIQNARIVVWRVS